MQQKDGTRMRTKYMKIESKKRKKLIISVSIIMVLLLSVKLISMYVNKIEHEKYILSLDNGMYTRALHINGEFEYERDKVIIKTMEIDRGELIIDVALYNEYNEEKLTVDGLIDDYYEFCATGKEQEKIDKFHDFNRASGHGGEEHPISRYEEYIMHFLNEKYDIKFSDQASSEQLQEAAQYAAERWHEDENEIYEKRKQEQKY